MISGGEEPGERFRKHGGQEPQENGNGQEDEGREEDLFPGPEDRGIRLS